MSIIAKLKQEIVGLEVKIASIQGHCSHPDEARTYNHGGDTGNWDKSADSSWTDHKCLLCEKEWRVDHK